MASEHNSGSGYRAVVCGGIRRFGSCVEWKNEGAQVPTWLLKTLTI